MGYGCGESPGFIAGRGLKLNLERIDQSVGVESPGFIAGRGLKHDIGGRNRYNRKY